MPTSRCGSSLTAPLPMSLQACCGGVRDLMPTNPACERHLRGGGASARDQATRPKHKQHRALAPPSCGKSRSCRAWSWLLGDAGLPSPTLLHLPEANRRGAVSALDFSARTAASRHRRATRATPASRPSTLRAPEATTSGALPGPLLANSTGGCAITTWALERTTWRARARCNTQSEHA